MGVIYKDLGKYPADFEAYQEASKRELSPEQVDEVKEGLVEVLTLQKEYAKALSILEDCAASTPVVARSQTVPQQGASVSGQPKMLACRAECLWGLDQAAEAKLLLDKVLKEQPRSAELLRLRAKLHLNENEPQQAAALLEQAVRLDRHDYQRRYQLAQAYQMLGPPLEASEQRRLSKETQDYFAELSAFSTGIH